MKVSEATLKICLFTLHVESSSAPEFIDITDSVTDFVHQSEIRNGFAVVFSRHTTAAIAIQENEPLLLEDMRSLIERIAPKNAHYRHNDFSVRTVNMNEDERPNGHSHCQHLAIGTSETLPVVDGNLALGQWQRVFAVELDGERPVSRREVLVQIMGV